MSSRPQPIWRLRQRRRMPAPNPPSPPSTSRRWMLTPLKRAGSRSRPSAGRGLVSITMRGLTSARTSRPSGRVAGESVSNPAIWCFFVLTVLVAPLAVMAENVPDALSVEWQDQKPCEKLFEDAQIRVARCTLPPGTAHVCNSHPSYVFYVLSGGKGEVQDEKGTRKLDLTTGAFAESPPERKSAMNAYAAQTGPAQRRPRCRENSRDARSDRRSS